VLIQQNKKFNFSFNRRAKCITTVFLFVQLALIATESNVIECEEHVSSQMQTFIVAPQDLHVDQDHILMNLNGLLYEVYSLRKSGHQWLAEAAVGETCAWGHPLCGYCHLCHLRICRLYQSRCSKSQ
jgi:hypothetical protein